MKIEQTADNIFLLDSGKPGPDVAIFAGIHGNEKAGVYALDELLLYLELGAGSVYLAYGNPPAIEQDVRFVGKNLNRCFVPGSNGGEYEDLRAKELMTVLDKTDALLDIHAFNDPEGEPFVICEEPSLEIAQKMCVPIISTNWADAEPGTADGYMYALGKTAICLECGPVCLSEEYAELAVVSAMQFLKHFDMVDVDMAFSTSPKSIVRADHSVTRTSQDYVLEPGFKNFQQLEEGQPICTQDGETYFATAGECIIFPRYDPPIGAEAYIIGQAQN